MLNIEYNIEYLLKLYFRYQSVSITVPQSICSKKAIHFSKVVNKIFIKK